MVYIKRAVGLILYLGFIALIGLFFYVLSYGFFGVPKETDEKVREADYVH